MAASTYTLPFAPGKFIEYLLSRPDVAKAWKEHTGHVFLDRLADGTLPRESFKYYLIQDYLYLIQFARANSLAGFKSKNLDDIVRSAEIVLHIKREMDLHLSYCAEFGLSKEDVLNVEESQACTAYTRFVLDTGSSEDWLALQVALAPCLIGYGQIAKRLYSDAKTVREGNRYWKWIENYAAEDYTEAVELGVGELI
jgi:thiaminase II